MAGLHNGRNLLYGWVCGDNVRPMNSSHRVQRPDRRSLLCTLPNLQRFYGRRSSTGGLAFWAPPQ